MTVTIDSTDPRSVKALALLSQARTWVTGRRKCDGRAFLIAPGSNGRTYYVAADGSECTCADRQVRRTTCKHMTAARLLVVERGAPAPAPLSCNNCGAALPAYVVGGSMCGSCWQAREGIKQELARAERAAYRARLRAELGMTEEAA